MRKACCHGQRLMSVAAKGQRFAARLVPPPYNHARERYGSIQFKRSASSRQRPQNVAVFLFKNTGVKVSYLRRPVTHWIVDMRQHDEIDRRFHQLEHFSQVSTHEFAGIDPADKVVHHPRAVRRQRVHGPKYTVDAADAEQGINLTLMPMRFAKLYT